jgi:hypothetical protein
MQRDINDACRCGAPLLSLDERALALCRDCERDDDALLWDYIKAVEAADAR